MLCDSIGEKKILSPPFKPTNVSCKCHSVFNFSQLSLIAYKTYLLYPHLLHSYLFFVLFFFSIARTIFLFISAIFSTCLIPIRYSCHTFCILKYSLTFGISYILFDIDLLWPLAECYNIVWISVWKRGVLCPRVE
jgi:hypothetical protein